MSEKDSGAARRNPLGPEGDWRAFGARSRRCDLGVHPVSRVASAHVDLDLSDAVMLHAPAAAAAAPSDSSNALRELLVAGDTIAAAVFAAMAVIVTLYVSIWRD